MQDGHETGRPRRARPAVMSDVGRLAGVSHQTVSRVINGSPHVRPETRDRVLAAMAELGYRPNLVARALVTGRSNTLGVVSFDTTLYGPASTLLGIERAAHEAGYFIIVASLKALDRESVRDAVDRLGLHGVDGIIAISPFQAAADAIVHAPRDIPLVAAEAGPHDVVPVAQVDQVAGARLATEHLLDLGHQTVWHIAGPSEFLESRLRVEGWSQTLRARGAGAPDPLEGDWTPESGFQIGQTIASDAALSAVFVANDQMALGVLRALHEAGRAVPEEVSIVGFDDVPEAAFFLPPLTTVRQDFDELGARSLRMLVQMIEEGVAQPTAAAVAPELVVRRSTGPPAHHR